MSDLAWMRPKLAELCGQPLETAPFREPNTFYVGSTYMYWRPDEDVAQALRCVEVVLKGRPDWIKIGFGRLAEVRLERDFEDEIVKMDASLPRAICLAIAAALGWETP